MRLVNRRIRNFIGKQQTTEFLYLFPVRPDVIEYELFRKFHFRIVAIDYQVDNLFQFLKSVARACRNNLSISRYTQQEGALILVMFL